MPTLTPAEPTTPTSKISREHLVLGAILAVVVLGAAAWFLLKGGSGATATPKTMPGKPAATTTAAPAVAVVPVAKKPVVTAQKAAFLKAGNKICTTMNAQEKALGNFPSTTTAAEAKFLAKSVAYTSHALARLRALHAPAGDAAKLKVMYADVAHLNALGAGAERALLAGNKPAAAKLMDQIAAAGDKANAAFNAYGLTVCGS